MCVCVPHKLDTMPNTQKLLENFTGLWVGDCAPCSCYYMPEKAWSKSTAKLQRTKKKKNYMEKSRKEKDSRVIFERNWTLGIY